MDKQGYILTVEDEPKVQANNKKMLERRGYMTRQAYTLSEARELITKEPPRAIILDIGMPDGSGLDFLRELRQYSKIPVLLLTGYRETADIVNGFDGGCDDYLTKPYMFEILLVRLRRLLEYAEQIPEAITRGLLTLNLIPQKAFVDGMDLLLTPKDFAMLQFFVQNESRVLGAEHIYERVWGQHMGTDSQAIQNAVSRLRKKICGCGYTVTGLYGKGYRFERE
ncbi:MAG: response regulator transcription factor [Oscillospiraceae bacterium]|nr:response regulator transcription factor [Oscillospiraceae bacterium]